jgi:hypothetical protein
MVIFLDYVEERRAVSFAKIGKNRYICILRLNMKNKTHVI